MAGKGGPMTTWLTSDLHLGHANIIGYCDRPFADVEDMDRELVSRWRERVAPDDVVWVLGDFALGSIADGLALAQDLPGEKHLVAGNHDPCWPGNGRRHRPWVDRYRAAGFVEIVTTCEIDLGEGVVLPACHFPYEGDSHGGDRFLEWRPADHGRPLLHGHVHELWRVKDRQVNVGVDVWDFAPVDAATLRAVVPTDGGGGTDRSS
ncbi:MAG: metallophosphoesterase [Acidimicrobiales bacterium]